MCAYIHLFSEISELIDFRQIDGHTNPHTQTLHVPELPISDACFHPSRTSILLAGPRPFYYTYDLQSGTSHRSPRGLWGTTFTNKRSTDTNAKLQNRTFSPTGDILAVTGRRGYIHVVDWKDGASGGQVIGSVKANSSVKSIRWNNQGELLSLSEDSEVYGMSLHGGALGGGRMMAAIGAS